MVKYLRALILTVIMLSTLIGMVIYSVFFRPMKNYTLSIAHMNDFDSQFEGTTLEGKPCKVGSACVGGFGKLFTMLDRLQVADNFILLNAGGNMQGSIWYTYFKWNLTVAFFNLLDIDAITLGIHDFDDGVENLVNFMHGLARPVIVCNINDSNQQGFHGEYSKSVIITRGGKKIGLIGVIYKDSADSTRAENLTFLDEIASVNAEAERLVEEGVFTNIVVSHCGHNTEMKMAERVGPKVTLIVGGGTHSLLYTGEPPSREEVIGPYPIVVDQPEGQKVLLVRAAYAKYLGNITITYDENGKVVKWAGNPIFLDQNVTEGHFVQRFMKPYKKILQHHSSFLVGISNIDIPHDACLMRECALGNLFADAMLESWITTKQKQNTQIASIAMFNPLVLNAGLFKGNITYTDLMAIHPSKNRIICITIEGKYIKKSLEESTLSRRYTRRIFQIAGMKIVLDMRKPLGERVRSIKVLCQNCTTINYEDFDPSKIYKVILNQYLTDGKRRFVSFVTERKSVEYGEWDFTLFGEYVSKHSPLNPVVENRIVIHD